MFSSPMYVESISIEEIFKNFSSVDRELLQPEDYSFLNQNNVYQSPIIVKAMLDCLRNNVGENTIDPISLVSFRPHRVLLQEIAVYFTVFLKSSDEENRNGHILVFYRKIVSDKFSYNVFLQACDRFEDREETGIYQRIKEKHTSAWYSQSGFSDTFSSKLEQCKTFLKKK